MSDKGQRTVRIKWVRSGIGFSFRQKEVVRSLGLRRLNQVVERPDTPQIRGLAAKVPHLVEILEEAPKPVWTSVPEYTIGPPEVAPAELGPPAVDAVEEGKLRQAESESQGPAAVSASETAAEGPSEITTKPADVGKAKKPRKRSAPAKTKPVKQAGAKKEGKLTKGAKPSKREKK